MAGSRRGGARNSSSFARFTSFMPLGRLRTFAPVPPRAPPMKRESADHGLPTDTDGSGMFQRLGRFAASHPWGVCLGWLAAGAVLALLAPRWDTRTEDDDVRFVPDRFTSVRAYHLMEKAF